MLGIAKIINILEVFYQKLNYTVKNKMLKLILNIVWMSLNVPWSFVLFENDFVKPTSNETAPTKSKACSSTHQMMLLLCRFYYDNVFSIFTECQTSVCTAIFHVGTRLRKRRCRITQSRRVNASAEGKPPDRMFIHARHQTNSTIK